ncbi:recombinase family protein [Corynebacterium belfantii]|uniref:recombinase family protein n=1 Tax=Corynebacterium belfantii TaxID=2014537 RepID=UPI002E1863DB|nr:recombinase family protein [Corynebacterium belfantii]
MFTDEVSGATRARPGLEEALRYVREGDQLIVTSMDRCARSLSDLYGIVDGLVGRWSVGGVSKRGADLFEGLIAGVAVDAGPVG